MKSATHTSFQKGKRVHLILTNGKHVVTKFIEKRSKMIVTEAGKFMNKDVSSATIHRGDIQEPQ